MPDLTIIQMSPDQIRDLVNEALAKAVAEAKEFYRQTEKETIDTSLLNANEICKFLNIGRTRFEHYKKELIKAGMFKLGKDNSSYLMKREDFDKWLSTKQQTAR